MKKLIITVCLMMCTLVMAEETLLRPIGHYQYNSVIEITKKRTAETVDHTNASGMARMNALKKLGFSCFRKNQIKSICQKIEGSQNTPDYVQKAVDDYLKSGSISFSGMGDPVVVHDGASTEWLIYEDVMIGNFKLEVYKLVKNNKGQWFASFPVSEEQGIANVEIKSDDNIALPLILESKPAGQTVAFFVSANFVKK